MLNIRDWSIDNIKDMNNIFAIYTYFVQQQEKHTATNLAMKIINSKELLTDEQLFEVEEYILLNV